MDQLISYCIKSRLNNVACISSCWQCKLWDKVCREATKQWTFNLSMEKSHNSLILKFLLESFLITKISRSYGRGQDSWCIFTQYTFCYFLIAKTKQTITLAWTQKWALSQLHQQNNWKRWRYLPSGFDQVLVRATLVPSNSGYIYYNFQTMMAQKKSGQHRQAFQLILILFDPVDVCYQDKIICMTYSFTAA